MKKYKCNADCPDIDYGQCCHPDSCIKELKSGIEIIAIERKRQIEELGYDYTNDALYANEELARAGAWYSLPSFDRIKFELMQTKNRDKKSVINIWPWDRRYYKPSPESRIKELAKAGALIAAQIDYLQNKTNISIK